MNRIPTRCNQSPPRPPKRKLNGPLLRYSALPRCGSLLRYMRYTRSQTLLAELDDSELLTTSRAVSDSLNYSIHRWVLKRHRLIVRNMAANTPHMVLLPARKEAQQPDNFVRTVGRKELLNNLTFRDVQELAQFELPKVPGITLREGRAGKEIDITPGSLPPSLYGASVSAQLLLFFVIVYFNAFAHEATLSAAFPVPGTLFSAFSRSYWTLLVYFLGLWSPFLASLSMAVTSRDWLLIGLSVLIGFAILTVHVVFHRKSYFKALNFVQLARSNRFAKNGASSDVSPSCQNPGRSEGLPNKPDAGDA